MDVQDDTTPHMLITDEDRAKFEEAGRYMFELFKDERYHFAFFMFVATEIGVQPGMVASLQNKDLFPLLTALMNTPPVSDEDITPPSNRTLN